MLILDGIASLRAWRKEQEREASIGLVPTMGALHEGHLSLIRRARQECDRVAVSVLVNPAQFGPSEDLATYPRDRDGDISLAADAGADLTWFTRPEEVYPGDFATRVELPDLTERLCGLSRPVHFPGVALIVLKLFHLFAPHRAYFGQKDYQQSVMVVRLVRDLDLEIDIIACPVIREESGLAMSSRNRSLTPSGLKTAESFSRALFAAQSAYEAGEHDGASLIRCAIQELADPQLRLEYLELVDPQSLEPVEEVDSARGARMLIAGQVEKVRLIDNVAIGGAAT